MHFDDRERKVDLEWDVSDQWQVTLFVCFLFVFSSIFLPVYTVSNVDNNFFSRG